MWWQYWLLLLTTMTCGFFQGNQCFEDREFWYENARLELARRLDRPGTPPRHDRAKNVVVFVGDGLGLATLTAARILKGQKEGKTGEEGWLAWDLFPAVALAKDRPRISKSICDQRNHSIRKTFRSDTYNSDAQIGDSAACATALLCGVKTNFGTVGVDNTARFNQCESLGAGAAAVPSLVTWAQEEGMATGIVTNARLTHATPAALYAHAPNRYWEDDSKVPVESRRTCKDIARQLVEDSPGKDINVILGGGRRHWEREGRRLDGRNLVDDWLRDKRRRGLLAHYVETTEELSQLNTRHLDYLLGIFAPSHMSFELDRKLSTEDEPSLSEMVTTAIRLLRRNSRGFLLVVEGGRIDHASHYNNAYRVLDETLSLESAVLVALSEVDATETLVVVTSDHSNMLTLGGLATTRGNAIFGYDSVMSDVDGRPYSTLQFANGPKFSPGRVNARSSAVPLKWATHGGEDVPVFTQGPMADLLFTGTFDQSYIPHAIAFAACLGEHKKRCSVHAKNYTLLDC